MTLTRFSVPAQQKSPGTIDGYPLDSFLGHVTQAGAAVRVGGNMRYYGTAINFSFVPARVVFAKPRLACGSVRVISSA